MAAGPSSRMCPAVSASVSVMRLSGSAAFSTRLGISAGLVLPAQDTPRSKEAITTRVIGGHIRTSPPAQGITSPVTHRSSGPAGFSRACQYPPGFLSWYSGYPRRLRQSRRLGGTPSRWVYDKRVAAEGWHGQTVFDRGRSASSAGSGRHAQAALGRATRGSRIYFATILSYTPRSRRGRFSLALRRRESTLGHKSGCGVMVMDQRR